MMANDDFMTGFALGYCLGTAEVRREIDAARQDVETTLANAAAETRRALDDFAQRHGLDVAAPLARPSRAIM